MQIKILLRFYSSPFRMVPSRKINDHQCWLEHGERQELTHCWWECKTRAAMTETGMEATQTLKLELLHDLAVLLLGLALKNSKSFPREISTAMYNCTVHSSKKMEQPRCPAQRNS